MRNEEEQKIEEKKNTNMMWAYALRKHESNSSRVATCHES